MLLEVKDLHTSFFTDAGEVRAVNGVSFNLDRGKVLGIVESLVPESPLQPTRSCRSWRTPGKLYTDLSNWTDRSWWEPVRK